MKFEQWLLIKFGYSDIHIGESTLKELKEEYDEYIRNNNADWNMDFETPEGDVENEN